MPNHCGNKVIITSSSIDELEKFRNEHPDVIDLMKIHEVRDDYDGHVDGWGTKWGCYEGTSSIDGNKLTYIFNTAWCPFNNMILEKISTAGNFEMVELWYAETGLEFCGYKKAVAGNIKVSFERKQNPELDGGEEEDDDGNYIYKGEYKELWEISG